MGFFRLNDPFYLPQCPRILTFYIAVLKPKAARSVVWLMLIVNKFLPADGVFYDRAKSLWDRVFEATTNRELGN
jgi:hypothetical protein